MLDVYNVTTICLKLERRGRCRFDEQDVPYTAGKTCLVEHVVHTYMRHTNGKMCLASRVPHREVIQYKIYLSKLKKKIKIKLP